MNSIHALGVSKRPFIIMNSADFFLLYLHLANHKIINNCTSYQQEVNDCKTGTFFLEQGSTKKAFCLLAFAGLRKSIAATEWRNPFGGTGFYNQVVLNNNFSQIMGKLRTLTSLKNSIACNYSYGHALVAKLPVGKSKTAAFGPSTFHVKSNNKPVFDIKSQEASLISSHKLRNKFNAQILSQSFKANYISHLKNCNGASFLEVNSQKQFLDKQKSHPLWAFNFASTLQSTGPSIEGQEAPLPLNGKRIEPQGRKDHGMSLVSWASMPYFSGRPASTNPAEQNLYSSTLVANPQPNSYGESVNRQLDELLTIPPLSPVGHALPTVKVEGQEKHFSPERMKTRARKITTLPWELGLANALRTFNKQSCLAGSVQQCLDHPGFVNVEKSSIKSFFDNAKQNSLSASADLTRFYTASWLLESIRAELLLRNSNIKRVLNQVFLLTQQSLYNSSKRPAFQSESALASSTSPFTPKIVKGPGMNQELISVTPNPCQPTAAPLALLGSSLVGLADQSPEGAQILKDSLSKATVIPSLIKGLRVTLSGRMGGRKGMAKTLTKTAGRVPSSTLREKVDFAKGVVQTKTGSLGIKVWICYN